MNEKKIDALNEDELNDVVGAVAVPVGTPIRNAKGDEVGYHRTIKDKTIMYYPCPRCKKPMHHGTFDFLYCDPCDYNDYGSAAAQVWGGTEEELAAASL